MINSVTGPAPLVLRVGVTPRADQVVGGPVENVSRIENYVLLSALPTELQERVKAAVQFMLAAG